MKRWLYNRVLKRFFWQFVRYELVKLARAIHMDGQAVGVRNMATDGFTADQAVRGYVETLKDTPAPASINVEIITASVQDEGIYQQLLASRGVYIKANQQLAQEIAEASAANHELREINRALLIRYGQEAAK